MDYRIAVVEDDELISSMLGLNLEKCGCIVSSYEKAEELLRDIHKEKYDLLILDIMLPGISGVELLKKIRSENINIPVLMMTAKTDLKSKIDSRNIGADDYIQKPFSMEELIARVGALVRRSRGERMIPSNRVMVINGFKVNLESRECESNSGKLVLSEKEIRFLEFLVMNSGEPQKRADILEEVWGMDVSPTPRTIDNFILKFRKLFEKDSSNPVHFISVRNKGYCYMD
ncbi:MAG: response regulator transcription factor [Candidatus Aminicenantes bacterium]|nr:response regulator transcription factor [Candidatus Aminicenantes bacterium]